MKRAFASMSVAVLVALALLVLHGYWASQRISEPRLQEHSRAQLEFLSRDLEPRADSMQALFPEGRVFTLALYGMAWSHVGRHAPSSESRKRALSECRRADRLVQLPKSLAPFSAAGGLPHGMFYEAWSNSLRAACLSIDSNPAASAWRMTEFAASCGRLASAFAKAGPFVDSYPGAAWPADSVVGAASLSACARWLNPAFDAARERWLVAARAQLDPVTGLLPHQARRTGARGSSSALVNAFLPAIDRRFAAEHYRRFREQFASSLFGGLSALREYPSGTEGPADVDSGPLLFGISAPATIVGIAAARANGDVETALALRRSSEAVGLGFEWAGQRSYGLGALPVGEAFLAWASVVGLEPAVAPAGPGRFANSQWRLLALAFTCVAALLGAAFAIWRRFVRPSKASCAARHRDALRSRQTRLGRNQRASSSRFLR